MIFQPPWLRCAHLGHSTARRILIVTDDGRLGSNHRMLLTLPHDITPAAPLIRARKTALEHEAWREKSHLETRYEQPMDTSDEDGLAMTEKVNRNPGDPSLYHTQVPQRPCPQECLAESSLRNESWPSLWALWCFVPWGMRSGPRGHGD
ncbi:hypothetical protein CKAH01_08384 [Colletotrichum kahawae]|uniref:Uncharacterized protein n=1 Tax=Colletotrichum kahawae TaxID=34407 RepID=A0AAD9Y4G7_COLKA|nr:hypothetical protein CKAH01_08384 [Colletotrichum kahawae]